MKKIKLVLIALGILVSSSYAQTKKAAWPEMKTFHSFMSATFHPAEDGDFKPLKAKSDSLLIAAKQWQASAIPANFKPAETKDALATLVLQCGEINDQVKANASDELLKKLITGAHDTFHKIAGECKKADD